jgi:hypothetical protein
MELVITCAAGRTNFIKIQKAMIKSGQDILIKIHKKWQLRFLLEIAMYALALAVLVYGITSNILFSVLGFMVVALVLSMIWKPWKYDVAHVSQYLDAKLPDLEYSTSLLLSEEKELTLLARLQREKIGQQILESTAQMSPERSLKKALITFMVLVLGAWLISYFGLADGFKSSDQEVTQQGIKFSAVDSTQRIADQPLLIKQSVRVRYPNYTRQAVKSTTEMNLKALQGSVITWSLEFDKKVAAVSLQLSGENHTMTLSKGVYSAALQPEASGFYNFKFVDTLGRPYFSELYSLELVEDQSPAIEVSGLSQFTSFEVDQNKQLTFEALLSDDYGLASAVVIATVSKGSGESVKFREEQLSFDNPIPEGSKRVSLRKKIDLDNMGMEPGDELYFYVEVSDVKYPNPNISKGETYFANIRDTISDVFEVDGSMGVDQMPDYFRSQRQLIIDTEKLIKEKPRLSKQEFNSKSNELAFDQKALRIKYGEFMGDESTLGINSSEEAHDEEEEENLLSEYEHAHDTENESNLVDDDHDEEGEGETEDPLHSYIHDHDDPEEATLYTKSLKAQLRMALNEMWDAELHLRLYHPEESLPVQYSILKRLQDIKNSARIYVHRIGFDPPPIKEDKRLTGDLKEVYSYKKTEVVEKPLLYPAIRSSVERLEALISNASLSTENDQLLFEAAGNELAELAIAQPGNYLTTLQDVKKLGQGFQISKKEMIGVQKGLLAALPPATATPEKRSSELGELNTLFINELEIND